MSTSAASAARPGGRSLCLQTRSFVAANARRRTTTTTRLSERALRSSSRSRVVNPGKEGQGIQFVEEEDRVHFRTVPLNPDLLGSAPSDFFQLLNLELDASQEDIRSAYRGLQRQVHPDLVGESATEMAVLLNKAYATLSDDAARKVYKRSVREYRSAMGGAFTGRPVSEWHGSPEEQRAVFVDETECIGCTHCSSCAPSTFFMEDHHGRARVHRQWGDSEDEIREAMDLCPVDCIHYVSRPQLALLEWVLQSCDREDIALMARRRSGNMGTAPASASPFLRAEVYMKYRDVAQSRVLLDRRGPGASQDDELAGAIAQAFLALPGNLRSSAWPGMYDYYP